MIDLPELPFIDTVMTTVVFYGLDDKLPAREVKALIESTCVLLNEMPSHAQVGRGEGKRSRSPRYGMLDKAIATGELDDYTFFEGVSYFQKSNARDCCLAVGVRGIPGRRIFEVHFKKEREKPVDLNAMLKEVLSHCAPEYGILYDLTVRQGPRWFISGVWSSGMPDRLGRASGEFKHEYLFGKRFTDGYFRDVFKWNYLNRTHLDRIIEGKRFQAWVEEPLKQTQWLGKSKTRGTLSLLDNGCAVWKLTAFEAAEIRQRMLGTGLLMVKN